VSRTLSGGAGGAGGGYGYRLDVSGVSLTGNAYQRNSSDDAWLNTNGANGTGDAGAGGNNRNGVRGGGAASGGAGSIEIYRIF
jgi:hypothetical protein